MTDPFASIVVPVLNDAAELGGLLRVLPETPDVEIVVVNGGQRSNEMIDLEAAFPAVCWIDSEPGRGKQMNLGAWRSRGRWLLFLHADARPAAGWLDELRRLDRDGKPIGGSFRLVLRSNARAARVIECGVARRVKWLGLPYGDQGLFVRRDVFGELGGYRDLPLMEDVDLVRRLARVGTLAHSSLPVFASARRWERDGWIRRTVENTILVLLYFAGVSPARLARAYNRGHEKPLVPPVADRDATRPVWPRVVVIIPALNEEQAIGSVLCHIPSAVTSVVVADNGSTDATADRARAHGARVVQEPRRGYGRACLAGLAEARDADIVVFLDADFSDYPEEMVHLVDPIARGTADFVIGVRPASARPLNARLGTALCVWLINRLWGGQYHDLGPFRAIRREALEVLRMTDQTWGWTIEMQIRALEVGLQILEVPIRQRERIGESKISGTVRGTVKAAGRMLTTIAALRRTRRLRMSAAHFQLNGRGPGTS